MDEVGEMAVTSVVKVVTGQENVLKVEEVVVVGEEVTDALSVGRQGTSRLTVLRGEKEGGGSGNHYTIYCFLELLLSDEYICSK